MSFEHFQLDPRLLEACRKAGYSLPTPVQKDAIPVCLSGRDLIATAATGTGKTAAFVLPIIHRLLASPGKAGSTRALIVTPTRELAEQIRSVIQSLSAGTRIRSAVVYGGVGFEPQKRALTDGTEIIVCCPGRLIDHMEKGQTRLQAVETVVLDEADRMLDMGFLPSIRRILDNLPSSRQTLLFSATFASELMDLIKRYLREPSRVSVSTEAPAETVDHCFYPVANHLKTDLLIGLLQSMPDTRSVLVFTRTKHRANKVCEKIQRAGFSAGVLHANKSQNHRTKTLAGFRSGEIKILVATDIAARGLDIAEISHVVNFDVPDTATTYIHRIGRTGRAERSGDALTFIAPEDSDEVRDIERKLGARVERKTLPGFDYQKAAPERPDHRFEQRGGGRPQHRGQHPRRSGQGHPSPHRPSGQGHSGQGRAAHPLPGHQAGPQQDSGHQHPPRQGQPHQPRHSAQHSQRTPHGQGHPGAHPRRDDRRPHGVHQGSQRPGQGSYANSNRERQGSFRNGPAFRKPDEIAKEQTNDKQKPKFSFFDIFKKS
jgi:ATP-dependent RNA helicase RhlE